MIWRVRAPSHGEANPGVLLCRSAGWRDPPAEDTPQRTNRRTGRHSRNACSRSSLLLHSAWTWAALPRCAHARRGVGVMSKSGGAFGTPHRAQTGSGGTAWLLGRTGWSTRPIASGTNVDGRESSALGGTVLCLTPLSCHDVLKLNNLSRAKRNARAGVTDYVTRSGAATRSRSFRGASSSYSSCGSSCSGRRAER